MNLKMIEMRMAEIATELNAEDITLERISALKSEVETLEAQKRSLAEAAEMRSKLLANVRDYGAPAEQRSFEPENVRSTPEYRNAFFKTLQGKELTEAEKRAYTTASSSSGNAVPDATQDLLFTKMTEIAPMLSEITLLRVAGNVTFSTQGARSSAAQHTENEAITAATDTLVKVSLTGYEYVKTLKISRAAQTMTIAAFEVWLVDMLAEDIAVAIEDAIINGTGSGGPKGVDYAATWSTTTNLVEVTGTYTIAYSDILRLIGKLPARYDKNAKFLANKAMIYQGLANIKDTAGRPIFVPDPTGAFPGRVLGFPVRQSDKTPAKTLFLGDYKKIVGNLAQDVMVAKDASAGFESNSIVYRGDALFDCTIALSDAFVKLTTNTY